MKAKDFIIICGAIALFYLYQKNKAKKSDTSKTEENQDEATPSGGGGGGAIGGGMPMPKPVTPKPATPKPLTPKGGTTSGGEAIFTGATPIRSTTNVTTTAPTTEVAIQQGGVSTSPRPSVIAEPPLTIEESLVSGGVTPIIKTKPSLIEG